MSGLRVGADPRKVLFVLGSGVSSFTCSTVDEITKQVLNPSKETLPDWFFNYDAQEEFVALVGFLNVLEEQASRTAGKVTYEDLFSMCEHLRRWELKLIQDPAMRLFRNQVFAESQKHWAFYAQEDKAYLQELPLAAIALRAQHLIHRVIRGLLAGKVEHNDKLNLISDTIEELGAENVDILTLNHDCLVESLLDTRGQPWMDGFDPEVSADGEVVNFHVDAFEDESRVRVIKLHGGWDWLYAGTNKGDFRWVKVACDKWIDESTDHNGNTFYELTEKAASLTGTTTKAAAYTEGLHGELYLVARELLREYDRIICSGYGWNDFGFNNMLHEWGTKQCWHEETRRSPRLLLLHDEDHFGEFMHPLNSARLRRNLWFWPEGWKRGLKEGWARDHCDWMRCYPKWLSDTSFREIDESFLNLV